MPTENEKFVADVIDFYQAFLGNVANSIETLSEIQKKHAEGYKKLKEIQLDPTKLFDKFKDMDMKQRGFLLDFFFRSANFEERLVTVFKLNPDDQKKLAQDIKKFLEDSKANMIGGKVQ